MSSYWVNFATNGDPNGKGLPKWAPFDDAKNPGALHLDDKIEMGPVLDPAQIAVFQSYYDGLYQK
jgi:carboxylesterase type B